MAEEKSMELKRQINRSTEIGNLDEALEALNSLMEIDGESAFAYNKLGIISARRGDMINAKAYLKALALDPQYAQAYSNLGNVHREAGDLGRPSPTINRRSTVTLSMLP